MIFSSDNINFENEPLFFGSGRNVARLDLNIEQWIQKLTDKQLGQTWFKHDFSYAQDAIDYNGLEPKLQELFLKNLKFQTVLDSVATRTVLEVFKPITTNPQLESWWTVHGFFEDIHSNSYAELIKALPVNSAKVFDDIIVNPNILSRAAGILSSFEDTVIHNAAKLIGVYPNGEPYNFEAHKKSLVLSLFSLNILEAGLFQTSFITTFAFAENGKMESSSKSMGKIASDEDLHMGMTVYLINQLKNDFDWKYIFVENEQQIRDMYKQAYEADHIWIDYLFENDTRMLGLNANVLKKYSQYNMYKAMTAIGLEPIVDKVNSNPCSWATKYVKTGNMQVALNEADGTAYLLGRLNKTITEQQYEELPCDE
jgi:ribonucleoside-diphosphate reductase beta chain